MASEPTRVLVFPARNEPGLEIIQSLSKSNKLAVFGGSSYGVDGDPGRHVLSNFLLCPGYDEAGFEATFKSLLVEHRIDVLFPAWDRVVLEFSRWRLPNTVVVGPRQEVAELVISKSLTYERLGDIIAVPRLYSPQEARAAVAGGVALFAKPDRESGSRGIMDVRTAAQLEMAIEQNLLLSEYLPGAEYTVDCLGALSGDLMLANVRERARILRGTAVCTRTAAAPVIREYVRRIADTLRIEGPWFAQFKENAAGEPVLTEINSRVAGSMAQTRLAGANIPLMSVFLFCGEAVRVPVLHEDVLVNRALRNFAETDTALDAVIWDWDDTLIRKDGKPDPDAVACLYDLRNRGVRQFLMTRNPDVEAAIARCLIPPVFESIRVTEDKVDALADLASEQRLDLARCIMVNDSYAERFAVEAAYPLLRVIGPDALELLGRETIE